MVGFALLRDLTQRFENELPSTSRLKMGRHGKVRLLRDLTPAI